jgi:hypothetical protein
MGASNRVIAGDYVDKGLLLVGNELSIVLKSNFLKTEKILLNKDTVESYEVITSEHTKNAINGVVRGAVGAALLGPVGLLAGGLSAKNKGVFTIAVKFRDGKNSLIEIDEKMYKALLKATF